MCECVRTYVRVYVSACVYVCVCVRAYEEYIIMTIYYF